MKSKICSVNLCLSCKKDVSKIIDLCRFSNLRKLYFVTELVLGFVYDLKRRLVCNLKRRLKVNQRQLSQDGIYFANLENQLRVVKHGNEIYRCEGRLSNHQFY